MNKIVLIGRLTDSPVLKYTQQGTAVTTFTLVVNRRFNRDETDFINIVTWRALAEHCAQYLNKGQLTAVEGRLQIRSYDGKDGIRRTVAEVVAEEVQFLEKKRPPEEASSQDRSEWDSLGKEINPDVLKFGDEVPF